MCDYDSRGTVEWEGCRVTLEGPADFVSVELDRFRNAALSSSGQHLKNVDQNGIPITDAAFVSEKMPNDHYEKIAVLAFRLKDSGKAEFNGEEMRRAYIRAGIKPPKVIRQALVDTKRFRDFIEPTSTKGSYRLTDHGENFVRFDLPRTGANKK